MPPFRFVALFLKDILDFTASFLRNFYLIENIFKKSFSSFVSGRKFLIVHCNKYAILCYRHIMFVCSSTNNVSVT